MASSYESYEESIRKTLENWLDEVYSKYDSDGNSIPDAPEQQDTPEQPATSDIDTTKGAGRQSQTARPKIPCLSSEQETVLLNAYNTPSSILDHH